MQQLFHSVFLQALGKAIADSIWQMGLLFLCYQLLIFLFLIKQASVKNLLSSVFALAGFTWFLFSIFLHWKKQLAQTASLVIENAGVNNSFLHAFTKDNRWQLFFNWVEYKLHFILPYLSVAYLFVLLWFAAKLVIQLQAAHSLRKNAVTAVSGDLQIFFRLLADSIGLHRNVEIFISKQIDIPATLGFLKPIVLLPVSAVTHLTPAQLEAVLLHELAHIKRNDYFWNLLLSVAETMLFFNPFALLLIGIARKERENSCDDQVMNFQQNAAVYAEALLTVEKVRMQSPQLVMALGDNKQHLMHRVKRILNLPADRNRISTRLLALVFFTFLFALTGWMIKSRTNAVAKEKKTEQKNNAYNSNKIVYVNPEAVFKKTIKSVSLLDEKRKLRLELKKELNEQELIVWDEQDGEQLKFDKVIFNDMPAEWIERFVTPGTRNIPRQEIIEREQELKFRNSQDSLHQWQARLWKEADVFKRMQGVHEQKYLKGVNAENIFTFQLPKKWNKDSLLTTMEAYFPEGFVFNSPFPEQALNYTFTQGEFQKFKQAVTDEVKQKEQKARLYYRKSRPGNTADNEKTKELFYPEAPSFAYMNDSPLPEEKRLNNERVNIIIENYKVYINEMNTVMADTFNIYQPPHPPKKIIKRLEIIRL